MATLETLRKSISEMTDEELDALLKEVRTGRRAPREIQKKKNRPKSGANPVTGISKTLARQLLAVLEGREDGTEGSEQD